MRQNLRSSELRFPRRVAASFNNLLENEPPPRVCARAGQQFRRLVHAQAYRFSAGRSANRSANHLM
jgi:hypothetical protein